MERITVTIDDNLYEGVYMRDGVVLVITSAYGNGQTVPGAALPRKVAEDALTVIVEHWLVRN